MSMPPNDLIKWCKQILMEVQEDGGTERVELWHHVEGEGGDRLHIFKNLSEHQPEDLAEAIWEAADGDRKTRSAGMIQRYAAQAFAGADDSDGIPEYMHAFIMTGGAAANMFGDDTEPSTPAGQAKQGMRLVEQLHKMLMQQTEMTAGRLARDYREERDARIKAENKLLEGFELYQKLLDKTHERDLERAEQVQNAKRTDQFMGLLMSVAPIVLMRFLPAQGGSASGPAAPDGSSSPATTGSTIGPLISGSPRSIALGRILLSIPRESAQTLLGSLSQMTQIAVMQLVASYQESPPGFDKSKDDLRDIAIREMLRTLSKSELLAILMALDRESQQEFLAIVKSYSAEEARLDEERPDVLKNNPPTNGKSHGSEETEESQGQA